MKTNMYNELTRLAYRIAVGTALLAAVPTLVGCQTKEQQAAAETAEKNLIHGDQFLPDDQPRDVHRAMDAMAAAGARNDATLHGFHFDGGNPGALNSLGEEKLDLMLADDDALPVVIFLDVAEDESLSARQDAVKVYLKDRGVTANQVKVVVGKNGRTLTATAPKIKAAAAAESAGAAAGGGAAGGSSGGAAAAK